MPRLRYRLAMETTSRRLDSTRMRLATSPSRRSRSSRPIRSRSAIRADSSSHSMQPGRGLQALLHAAGQDHLFGGGQQLGLADLLEVHADRIGAAAATAGRGRAGDPGRTARARLRQRSRRRPAGPALRWRPPSSSGLRARRSLSGLGATATAVVERAPESASSARCRPRTSNASGTGVQRLVQIGVADTRSVSSRHSMPSACTRPMAASIRAGVSSTDSMTLMRSSGVR